jgi:DNA-binding PadR family transcriptional regulator
MELDQCACSGKTLARLLAPAVMALLARGKAHGYEIVQRLHDLEMFTDLPPDTSGVYKALKLMEEKGLVSFHWEFGDAGPAKKSYTLTEDGLTCLKKWAETLGNYRAQIDDLLSILDLRKKLPTGSRKQKCCCVRPKIKDIS